MNTLKHSAKLSLQVIDRSKIILPLFCFASRFLCLPDFVRDSLSGRPCLMGLYLGCIRSIQVSASVTQLCGFQHPISLSFVQSWHMQAMLGRWSGYWVGCHTCAVILTKSATILTLCFHSRHFALELFRGRFSVATWYQAGSCARMYEVILIMVSLVLYFFAILSILLTSLFSLSAFGPLSENFHVCRSGSFLASSTSLSGSMVRIMWLVIIAHCWRDRVKFRYTFSHINSIASFLA